MRTHFILVAALFAVTPMVCASQDAPRVVNVNVQARGDMPVSYSGHIMYAACDENGNVYTQLLSPALDTATHSNTYLGPVQKITPEVKSAGVFRFGDAFSDRAESRAFSVHDNRLYVLAGAKNELYVVEFANDGSMKAPVKLQIDSFLIPFHFAVFPSGEYLVVGLTGTISQRPDLHTPFTAVFAADGRLVKKIYEPEDENARQRGEAGDSRHWRYTDSGNEFIGWDADVTSGSDGNVYLLHGFSPQLIYVISPKGDVVRKVQIDTGNPELAANSIKFYAGRLAVGYGWLGDVQQDLIKVIDLEGNSIADYEVREGPKDSDLILACYNAEGFTLIPRWADTKLHLLIAKTR